MVQTRYRQRLREDALYAATNAEKTAALAALARWDREHPELLPYFAGQEDPAQPRPVRRVDDLEYGTASLRNVSPTDPISLGTVDPDRAVYLEPNVVGGKATAMYDYGQLDTLLARGHPRSPMTRRPFSEKDIKRAPRAEVERLIARAARLSYFSPQAQ